MYRRLGFSVADVAQFLQVSQRTVHVWLTGRVRIPFAAYKLLRIQLHYELPGEVWRGWHLSAGRLYTPEGHELRPQDFTWWGLLIRRAALFPTLYAASIELQALRRASAREGPPPCGVGARAKPGLVPSINSAETRCPVPASALVNQGLTQSDITDVQWYQTDHKLISPCPTPSGSRQRSTKRPAPLLSALESASTPLSLSPLMATFAGNLAAPLDSLPNPLGKPPAKASLDSAAKTLLGPAIALPLTGGTSMTPICGPTLTLSSPIDSATTQTMQLVSPLSLNIGRPEQSPSLTEVGHGPALTLGGV